MKAIQNTSFPGLRALLCHEGNLYAAQGYRLFRQGAEMEDFEEIANYRPGMLARWRQAIPAVADLFREGFHGLTVRPDGAMVGIVRKGIVYAAPGSRRFDRVLKITRGSRPLKLCQFPDGEVAFGEYFSNGRRFQNKPEYATGARRFEREAVHIYSSRSGKEWKIAFTFPPNTIRHIHGIFYDEYRDCAWILTGDLGQETGIWVSYDRFRTVEPLVRGTQAARAVWMFPMRDRLIVPMDSNLEENFIHHVDPETGEMRRVASLPGPVVSGAWGDKLVLSTMIDYSEIELHDKLTILTSDDGFEWEVAKEFSPGKHRLSHPRIMFAAQSADRRVFSYGIKVMGGGGNLTQWVV